MLDVGSQTRLSASKKRFVTHTFNFAKSWSRLVYMLGKVKERGRVLIHGIVTLKASRTLLRSSSSRFQNASEPSWSPSCMPGTFSQAKDTRNPPGTSPDSSCCSLLHPRRRGVTSDFLSINPLYAISSGGIHFGAACRARVTLSSISVPK